MPSRATASEKPCSLRAIASSNRPQRNWSYSGPKIQQIRNGTIPRGDIGTRARCALVLLGAGASVAAAGLALPAVAVAGAATAAIAYTSGGVALWWVGTAAAAVVSWSGMRCSLRLLRGG